MSAPAKVNGWTAEPVTNGHNEVTNGHTGVIKTHPLITNGHNGLTDMEDTPLYCASLLKDLDLSHSSAKFSPTLTMSNPGDGLIVRPLNTGDYDRGFLTLLGQLTTVGDISREQWEDRFMAMKNCANTYLVTVIEDVETHQVIGAATLVVEQKFIHACAVRGRLEDVVVSDLYRGRQLGKLIVTVITLLAKKLDCYKITLDCKDSMIKFYTSLGFNLEPGNGNYMQIRM